MSVVSFSFLALILAGLLLFHLSSCSVWKKTILAVLSILLLASYVPGEWDNIFTLATLQAFLPLGVFIAIGYLSLYIVRYSIVIKTIVVLVVVALFFYFRQYDIVKTFAPISYPIVAVGLPYIIFRILQINIDYFTDRNMSRPSLGAYLYHMFAFYSLLAGPLINYQEHQRQLNTLTARELSVADTGAAFSRILTGALKVMILAKLCMLVADGRLVPLQHYLKLPFYDVAWDCALGALAFFLSIYFNFSGYMDVVNGSARLFLLSPPENFDQPLLSKNVLDFWTRWHITVSFWFRDYFFTPLLLIITRMSLPRKVNILGITLLYFITFFLLGLWHGPTTRFIVIAAGLGAITAINFLWAEAGKSVWGKSGFKRLQNRLPYQALAGGLTIACVALVVMVWAVPEAALKVFATWEFSTRLLPGAVILLAMSVAVQQALKLSIKVYDYMRQRIVLKYQRCASHLFYAALLVKAVLVFFCLFYNLENIQTFVYQDF